MPADVQESPDRLVSPAHQHDRLSAYSPSDERAGGRDLVRPAGVIPLALEYALKLSRLQRSVIIDDAALRPVAISAQTGLVDDSRIEAVLQRRTSPRHRRLLTERGVFTAPEPVRIPAAEAGSLPRLCLPLLNRDQLLGFLWLIDEPPLTAAQSSEPKRLRRRPRGCCISGQPGKPRSSTLSQLWPTACFRARNKIALPQRAS